MNSLKKHSEADEWARRQRRTSRLVRLSYEYLVKSNRVNAKGIHALCRLTWITKSKKQSSTTYLYSTKLPALEMIFEGSYQQDDLNNVVKDIQKKTGKPLADIRLLIESNTGFTNFYNTFRNSSLDWVRANQIRIKAILAKAYTLGSDNDGAALAALIGALGAIPSPTRDHSTHTEYLLTPLCFCLDPRLRFPIINGADNVKRLLREFNVTSKKLDEKYSALVSLLGSKGVNDAADLDQLRKWDSKELQQLKNEFRLVTLKSRDLPLKDVKDYEVLKKNLSVRAKRIHNDLTNQLVGALPRKIVEGLASKCRYDALVKEYDGTSDLLIEVKASTEISDVRMAIGQLFDYHRQFDNRDQVHMAVLLPKEPGQDVKDLLGYAEIGLLWFKGKQLAGSWW